MLDSLTLDDVLECGQQTQELVRLVCSLSCKEMRAVVSTIFSNKLASFLQFNIDHGLAIFLRSKFFV